MWWWVLIWALLVVVSAAYLGSRAWATWGRLRELGAEVHRASGMVAALQVEVERLGEQAPEPDIFGDPRALRREREATRASLRRRRRARAAAGRPAWARHLD
ncbi:hypothetical protein [Pedococcus sp. 5OH_020]|uniref:hypothetical protein n=1 Tax=Pedococcus sp. 5OH_020 TaxID=2989814 RepID=UPI0022E9BE39|nr:hypothetical protein [Pedococcus sp. 5OH_020]